MFKTARHVVCQETVFHAATASRRRSRSACVERVCFKLAAGLGTAGCVTPTCPTTRTREHYYTDSWPQPSGAYLFAVPPRLPQTHSPNTGVQRRAATTNNELQSFHTTARAMTTKSTSRYEYSDRQPRDSATRPFTRRSKS